MNPILKAILIGSVSIVGGYLAFRATFGKQFLSDWLIKKWQAMAKRKGKELDIEKLIKELKKLEYPTLEVLVRFTHFDIMTKIETKTLNDMAKRQGAKLIDKLSADPAFQKADFKQLTNIVFPGG